MVDWALRETSNSVPQSKQTMCRRSRGAGSTAALRAGFFETSWMRMCPRHFLQMVEKAPRGSACECPQCGQSTMTLSGLLTVRFSLLTGMQRLPARGSGDELDQRPGGRAGSESLRASPGREAAGEGETLFGLTSVLPT